MKTELLNQMQHILIMCRQRRRNHKSEWNSATGDDIARNCWQHIMVMKAMPISIKESIDFLRAIADSHYVIQTNVQKMVGQLITYYARHLFILLVTEQSFLRPDRQNGYSITIKNPTPDNNHPVVLGGGMGAFRVRHYPAFGEVPIVMPGKIAIMPNCKPALSLSQMLLREPCLTAQHLFKIPPKK